MASGVSKNSGAGGRGINMRLQWNWDANAQMELIFEEVTKVGIRIGKAHKKDREKTVATWQGDKPAWRYYVRKFFPKKVRMVIQEEGEPFGRKKWMWLDEGTRVRYMHVSANWESKTKVGRLKSGQGKGWTTGLGHPLPGIDARGWTEMINAKLAIRMMKQFKKAVKKGLQRRRKGKFGGRSLFFG